MTPRETREPRDPEGYRRYLEASHEQVSAERDRYRAALERIAAPTRIGEGCMTAQAWVDLAQGTAKAALGWQDEAMARHLQVTPAGWQDEAGDVYCDRCHLGRSLGRKPFREDELAAWTKQPVRCDYCGVTLSGGGHDA